MDAAEKWWRKKMLGSAIRLAYLAGHSFRAGKERESQNELKRCKSKIAQTFPEMGKADAEAFAAEIMRAACLE